MEFWISWFFRSTKYFVSSILVFDSRLRSSLSIGNQKEGAGDSNTRKTRLARRFPRCNKFGARFIDTGRRRCRQENDDVDDDCGAGVAWLVAVPRNDTHSTSGRHRRRTHEYVHHLSALIPNLASHGPSSNLLLLFPPSLPLFPPPPFLPDVPLKTRNGTSSGTVLFTSSLLYFLFLFFFSSFSPKVLKVQWEGRRGGGRDRRCVELVKEIEFLQCVYTIGLDVSREIPSLTVNSRAKFRDLEPSSRSSRRRGILP